MAVLLGEALHTCTAPRVLRALQTPLPATALGMQVLAPHGELGEQGFTGCSMLALHPAPCSAGLSVFGVLATLVEVLSADTQCCDQGRVRVLLMRQLGKLVPS